MASDLLHLHGISGTMGIGGTESNTTRSIIRIDCVAPCGGWERRHADTDGVKAERRVRHCALIRPNPRRGRNGAGRGIVQLIRACPWRRLRVEEIVLYTRSMTSDEMRYYGQVL